MRKEKQKWEKKNKNGAHGKVKSRTAEYSRGNDENWINIKHETEAIKWGKIKPAINKKLPFTVETIHIFRSVCVFECARKVFLFPFRS